MPVNAFDHRPDRPPTVSNSPIPFPTLILDEPEPWQWPKPPFEWRHRAPPPPGVPQPCRIEGPAGSALEGELFGFEPQRRTLSFRTAPGGPVAELPFSRLRRLTLTTPLQPVTPIPGTPPERVPAASQEREYRLQAEGTTAPALIGRTAGRVETAEGMFLFPTVDDDASLLRAFVPRSAYSRAEFGPSAEEVAARMWIASPATLLEALERQQRMPIKPLGHSMLALGLITQAQLDRALAEKPRDKPLGETLVASGLVSRSDLQTALAHKMGYPLVDLARFPLDPRAAAKLPPRVASGFRMVPLLLAGQRLIVAVDKPARVIKLGTVHAIAGVTVVPVLASRVQIALAQQRMAGDIWAGHVGGERFGFFATTI